MNAARVWVSVCLAVGLLAGMAVGPNLSRAAGFRGLGHLPGYAHSVANDVSADGEVVVGESRLHEGAAPMAFRWTPETGMQSLGDLPGGGAESLALGVSADGSAVAGTGSATDGSEAFRWTTGSGMVGLGTLPGAFAHSEAYGISADGNVVVGQSIQVTGQTHAFRWTSSAGMVGLGSLGAPVPGSRANAASFDGSVVVGDSHSPNGVEAFRWTEATGMVGLGALSSSVFESKAMDVSADGSVVIGYSHRSGNVVEAFWWTSETGMVGLGMPAGQNSSYAYGVSGDGSVVVGDSRPVGGGDRQAVLWDTVHGPRFLKEVLTDECGLSLMGWELHSATAVSPDGRIVVGQGRNPTGQYEAWLAFIPEPATAGLLVLGALLVPRRRWSA